MSDAPFVAHRRLLFTVAYELLGSAADAEDVVQETWLRWAATDRAAVRDPLAYLVRIVTRQALNRLRTLARQREDYVGAWLSEPLLTGPDVAPVVRVSDGEVLTTDGPFAESKEHLAGFYIVEAADLDAALGWASRTSAIIGMPIEVRPFLDTNA